MDLAMAVALIVTALCPMSMLIGVVGGVLLLHKLRPHTPSQGTPGVITPYREVPQNAIPAVIAAMQRAGYRYVDRYVDGDRTSTLWFLK